MKRAGNEHEPDLEKLKLKLELAEVPAAVEQRLRQVYAELPEELPKKKRTARPVLRRIGAAAGAAAAAFLLLFGVNAVNPAFAEELPVIGRLFTAVNDGFRETVSRRKTVQGAAAGTYGAREIGVSAESAGSVLTVEKAFCDGRSMVLSLRMTLPAETAERIDRFGAEEYSLTAGGKPGELLDPVSFLADGKGAYTGSVTCSLPEAAGDGETLSATLALGGFSGRDKTKKSGWPGSDLSFEGSFELTFDVTADASAARTFPCGAEDNGARLLEVEFFPTFTRAAVEKPFWGWASGEGAQGMPRLLLEDGSEAAFNLKYSAEHGYDPFAREGQTASLYFDGVPAGTERAVLRFYRDSTEEEVLAELTVDLAAETASPSRTYEQSGPLSLDSPFRYKNLSGTPEAVPENGLLAEALDYFAPDSLFTLMVTTPEDYRELRAEVLNGEGTVIASTLSRYGTKYENKNWFWDKSSPFWEGYARDRGGENAPNAYRLQMVSEGWQPAWKETLTIRLTDAGTGEVLLERNVTLTERQNN